MIDKKILEEAVAILQRGGLVAMPTETVYGLCADAGNALAVKKIFDVKQRPSNHPVIVHLAEIEQINDWAVDVSLDSLTLAKTFWPGPLTLILKKAPHVLDEVTGQQDSIGLRIPNHPVALALLKAFGKGLAAPSANRFGRISPTTAEAVREELGDRIELVLEGGMCTVGVESTIVDMRGEFPIILRPGIISAEQIEQVLNKKVVCIGEDSPRVSGHMKSHYAPSTEVKLISAADLSAFLLNLTTDELPIGLMTQHAIALSNSAVHQVVMPSSVELYAHDLYQALRQLDKMGFKRLIIEEVPDGKEWNAVRDRLNKAAS